VATEVAADSSTKSSGKHGHNARTQARNSRGQFAPAPELYVLSDFDSDDDVNPAAMRLALEAPETGRKRGKGEVTTPAKKKAPVTGAKAGKGAASGGGQKKGSFSSAKGGKRAPSSSSKKKVRAIFLLWRAV